VGARSGAEKLELRNCRRPRFCANTRKVPSCRPSVRASRLFFTQSAALRAFQDHGGGTHFSYGPL